MVYLDLVLRAFSDQFDPGAAGIQVDMERLLYSYKPELDIKLKPNDRIIVPYGNFEVFFFKVKNPIKP